jgi:Tfp pilus assembly protein PilN
MELEALMFPRDLDDWHSERALEREAAPRRHAVAAWLMAALLVAVGVFGGSATREAAHGIGALRQEARVLDHRLGDLSTQLAIHTANAAERLVSVHPAAGKI